MTQIADRPEGTTAPVDHPQAPKTHTVVHEPAGAATDRPRPVSASTAEDRVMLLGSVFASLALTWLLYDQVLPFSGKIGFAVVWFVAYIGIYSAATAVTQPTPIVVDRIVSALVQGGAALVLAVLVWSVGYTFVEGFPAYRHLNFFTQDGSQVGPLTPLTQGGIEHAIVGSLIELAIAVVISLPLGLATAIYLAEVGGPLSRVVRTVVEAMTALPDLIAGLFVYAFLIVALGGSRTGLAAGIALSITMLPIIARSAEVVLRIVPGGLREASLALGTSQWRTTWSVVLPTAKAGLATSLILGMARGIGESAPVLIVSAPSQYFNVNPLQDPMNSLPLYAISALRAPDFGGTHARGWGAASVLLFIVIILFAVVRLLARQRGGKR